MPFRGGGMRIHGPGKNETKSSLWRCTQCQKVRWSLRQPRCHGIKMVPVASKKQIKKAAKQRKQDAADVRRARLIKGPPRAADGKKFKAKAIKKGNKRRTKKAARKAERKARGF